MKLDAHGGDLLAMASVSKRDPASLLDFSVNVRPEGAPEFLRAALVRANTGLAAYPSPNAEEALAAAARRYGLPAGRFAFGNGSNELIHALARVLKRRGAPCVSIVEPAFSEYALACRLAGLESSPLWGGIGSGADGQPSGDLLAGLAETPSGSAVFLANPCNPSGLFRTPDECLSLLGGAARPALDHRRGLHRIRRAGSRCVDPAPDALQRRSTAFADQIPCLAGGAHRLSGRPRPNWLKPSAPICPRGTSTCLRCPQPWPRSATHQTSRNGPVRKMPNAAPISQPSYPASPAWRCSPPPPTTCCSAGEAPPKTCTASCCGVSGSPCATVPTTAGSTTEHGSAPPSVSPRNTTGSPAHCGK